MVRQNHVSMKVVVVLKYGKTRLNVTEVDSAEWRFPKFKLYEDTGKIAQKTFSENATCPLANAFRVSSTQTQNPDSQWPTSTEDKN